MICFFGGRQLGHQIQTRMRNIAWLKTIASGLDGVDSPTNPPFQSFRAGGVFGLRAFANIS